MIESKKEKPAKRGKRGRPKKGETAESKKPKPPKEKGYKSNIMNDFLQQLSDKYSNDKIVLCLDKASWHTSDYIKVPSNITLIYIPPYTPEMNPIEQLWREIRTRGFKNKYFKTLEAVIVKLIETIKEIPRETIQSITRRDWFAKSL